MKTEDGSTRGAKHQRTRRAKNLAITPRLVAQRIQAPLRRILGAALAMEPDDCLIHLVLHAATEKTSITDASRTIHTDISRRTATDRLAALDLSRLEAELNRVLEDQTTSHLPRRAEIAIDLTFIPYHGKPHKDLAEIKRSKAQSGTTWFHCYATAYLCHQGKRHTLAIRFVYKQETPTEALMALVLMLKKRGIRFKVLYADKGFLSLRGIRFLRAHHIPFIIPLPLRGHKARALQAGRGAYKTTYRLGTKTNGTDIEVHVCVKRNGDKYHGRKKGNQHFPYVVDGLHTDARTTDRLYRKRVGIETSYRLMNRARARTSSRNPALRLLYFGLSMVIQNAWVRLRWWASPPRRGRTGRSLPKGEFTFETLLRLLRAWLALLAHPNHYPVFPTAGRYPR